MPASTSASISVVIPAFNAGRFLADALASVASQSMPVAEILVIDDGSTDDCAAIAEDWGASVRAIRQPHSGAASARNHGARLAENALLAFLDADDVWQPGKLAAQLAALDGRHTDAVAFGFCREFSDPPGRFPVRSGQMAAPSPSALLVARSTFFRVGPLREDMAVGEMADWITRAQRAGVEPLMVEQALFDRRVHADNLTRRLARPRSAYIDLIRERRDAARQQS
ncbi:glycosyltransferase family 2 protein [Blastomonas sp. SL216]|uniref:glycosyltransferase family 2 protein n=1 Tax=Blastomonas sp. SL216 TaxID=2995169 RepID=UPI00237722EC|nr:glycosyltransferase family A protein [Blastomonas sp. SL216]